MLLGEFGPWKDLLRRNLRCNGFVGGALAIIVGGFAGFNLVGFGAQATLNNIVGIAARVASRADAGGRGRSRSRSGIASGLKGLDGGLGSDADGEKSDGEELHCGWIELFVWVSGLEQIVESEEVEKMKRMWSRERACVVGSCLVRTKSGRRNSVWIWGTASLLYFITTYEVCRH